MRRFEAELENDKEVDADVVGETAVDLQTAWGQLQNWEDANNLQNFMAKRPSASEDVEDAEGDDFRHVLDIEALEQAGWRHVTNMRGHSLEIDSDVVEIWCSPMLEYAYLFEDYGKVRTGVLTQERLDRVRINPGFLIWLATKIPARQSRR
jgi:hypothetical protein